MYSAVKTAVLEELKVTPEKHRDRFMKAMKRKDEGWAQFGSRLTSQFSYYIEARETKTLEALIELMVADRFKECLSPEAQRHVTLREEGGWLRAHEMSKIIDTFGVAEGEAKSKGAGDADAKKGEKTSNNTSKPKLPPRCYVCNEGSHLARDCPQRSQKDARDEKLADIEVLERPQTKRELRSVLGLLNHCRDYVPGCAAVAEPLTRLTKRGFPNVTPWPQDADDAFRDLKRAPCDAVAPFTPCSCEPYWLFTGASSVAAGACLAQMSSEGRERPITFASHRFDPTQARWSTMEREAFAIIWSLRKFDQRAFGARVDVVSDHDPLSYLTSSTPHGAKLARWALALQRYDVVVSHQKGLNHGNAEVSPLPNQRWEE